VIFHGSKGEKIEIVLPGGARQGEQHIGKKMTFQGVVRQIVRHYHWYRKQGRSMDGMEAYLQKVMVDFDCPDWSKLAPDPASTVAKSWYKGRRPRYWPMRDHRRAHSSAARNESQLPSNAALSANFDCEFATLATTICKTWTWTFRWGCWSV
jgi:hypothetical protein